MHECKRKIKDCCGVFHKTPGNVVLSLKNVSFRYPNGTQALEHVNLKIIRNSSVAVMGPNGGGKTTLLKIILGILQPSSGELTVMGTPPHKACTHLGYVPQYTSIRPDFPITVREVILQGCASSHRLGWHPSECKRCVNSVLEELELDTLARRPFCKLSGGERQRVLIARALAGHPDLLLLDEPLANVDPASRAKFREILQGLSERMTVMTVSHDLGYLSDDVDLVVFINGTSREYEAEEIRSANIRELYRDGVLEDGE